MHDAEQHLLVRRFAVEEPRSKRALAVGDGQRRDAPQECAEAFDLLAAAKARHHVKFCQHLLEHANHRESA